MIVAPPNPTDSETWARTLSSLEADIRAWSAPQGWTVTTSEDTICVAGGEESVYFEPQYALGETGDSRIDVYSATHNLSLSRRCGVDGAWTDWTVFAPGGIPLHEGWSEATFLATVRLLFKLQSA